MIKKQEGTIEFKPDLVKAKLFSEALLKAESLTPLPQRTSCIPDEIMFFHVRDLIPKNENGEKLKNKILDHLISCKLCRERTRKIASLFEVSISKRVLMKEQQIKVSQLIQSLAILSGIQRTLRRKLKAGYRRGEEELAALIVDDQGELMVDNNGQPFTVRFTLLEALIDQQGSLKIKLKTDNKAYWKTEEKVFEVQASLQYQDKKIILPPKEIYKNGNVTIMTDIRIPIESKTSLPATNIQLIVKRKMD